MLTYLSSSLLLVLLLNLYITNLDRESFQLTIHYYYRLLLFVAVVRQSIHQYLWYSKTCLKKQKIKERYLTFFMLATITIIVTSCLIGFYCWWDLIRMLMMMMMMLCIDICTYWRKKNVRFIDLFCSMSSAVYKKKRP